METKICTKCKQTRTLEDFNFKFKSKGIYHSQCKLCTRKNLKNHYLTNKKYYLDKAKLRNSELREEINYFILNFLKNHSCVDCGESDPTVLEFDHRDRTQKDKPISSLSKDRRIDKIRIEIEKCDVRCANCHRKRTANQFNWFKLNKQ